LGLEEIRSLARPELNTGRTLGLVGGILAGMVTVVAVAIDDGPQALALPAEGSRE
jgi:hypothetical protein